MQITVTLHADYLARAVSLAVRKRYPSRRWEIVAIDANGTQFPIAVDGSPLPDFRLMRDAMTALESLKAPATIWAAPGQRRAYVRPATGRPAERAASCAAS